MAPAPRRGLRLAGLGFVEPFATDLCSPPEQAYVVGVARFLRRLLETYVEGAADVLGYLDQLAELDALVPEVDFRASSTSCAPR